MTSRESEPFADESVEVSADLLDDYIQGKLPPEQQAEFESYIIDKPDLIERAELELLLQEGFRASETATVTPSANSEPRWRIAAAAAIVSLGIGTIIGYSVEGDVTDPRNSASALLTSQVVNLPITRSEPPRQTEVSMLDDIDVVVLRVPLPNPESRPYALTIVGDSGPVGAIAHVRPDGGGVLSIAVEAANLSPGNYSITVDDGSLIRPLELSISTPP